MSSVDELMALVRELSSARWSAGVSAGNFDKIGERVASKEADELEAEISALASSMAQWQDTELADFELHCNGELEASSFGPRAEAWREIQQYARQYSQDGPVAIYEVRRVLCASPLSASPEDKPK